MKRILVLNYEFPPIGGGGGVASFYLAKGFVKNGYTVDFITTGFKDLKKFEVIEGVNVHRVPVIGRKSLATATLISMLSYLVTGLWQGIRLCRKNQYEFMNTHFVIPTGPLGYALSKIFGMPNILSLHGGDIYDPTKKLSPHNKWYLRAAVRFLLNHAAVLIAQSRNTKENTIKYYAPKKEVQIIPLPYEPIPFVAASKRELGLKEDKKYVIGVGRLIKRKGFDLFIRTLALLDSSVEGIIVGDGPEREYLLATAREAGVSGRLHMAGYVSQEKKFQYLSNADAFMLTSVHEGFGVVLQEAMQAGLPIVATNTGGQVELVEEGKNGFLIGDRSPESFAEKITALLSDGDAGRKRGAIAAKLGEFDLKAVAGRYIQSI